MGNVDACLNEAVEVLKGCRGVEDIRFLTSEEKARLLAVEEAAEDKVGTACARHQTWGLGRRC